MRLTPARLHICALSPTLPRCASAVAAAVRHERAHVLDVLLARACPKSIAWRNTDHQRSTSRHHTPFRCAQQLPCPPLPPPSSAPFPALRRPFLNPDGMAPPNDPTGASRQGSGSGSADSIPQPIKADGVTPDLSVALAQPIKGLRELLGEGSQGHAHAETWSTWSMCSMCTQASS